MVSFLEVKSTIPPEPRCRCFAAPARSKKASRPCKPDGVTIKMKEKDEDIAHPGVVSKLEKTLTLAAQIQ
jgi:hypothetical protein